MQKISNDFKPFFEHVYTMDCECEKIRLKDSSYQSWILISFPFSSHCFGTSGSCHDHTQRGNSTFEISDFYINKMYILLDFSIKLKMIPIDCELRNDSLLMSAVSHISSWRCIWRQFGMEFAIRLHMNTVHAMNPVVASNKFMQQCRKVWENTEWLGLAVCRVWIAQREFIKYTNANSFLVIFVWSIRWHFN